MDSWGKKENRHTTFQQMDCERKDTDKEEFSLCVTQTSCRLDFEETETCFCLMSLSDYLLLSMFPAFSLNKPHGSADDVYAFRRSRVSSL